MKVGLYVTFFLSLFLFENCTSWPAMILALFGGGGKGGSMILLPPGGSENPTGSGNLGNQNNTGNQPSNPNNPNNNNPATPPNVEFVSASSNGLENVSPVSITVQLSSAYTSDITVDYSVTGGTATAGTDFTLNNGTLTFPAGTTTQTISLSLVDDNLPETNETIVITLDNPSNGASLGANNTHTFTIIDDDSPNVSFASATSSGSETSTTVVIPVNLSMSSPLTITVDYAVTGGTATGGGVDYTLASGTLTFNPGDLTKNITFTVVNDTLDEDDETVQVTISSPTNATLGTNTVHTYTINDDDSPPTVEFATASSSGYENSSPAVFTVSLSSASGKTITVDYSVNGITATNGGVDFNLSAGTLTFAPGQTTKTISATIVNDSLNEANETFSITLNNPSNVTLGTNQTHTYTILDDDPQPTIQFASASSSTPDESATNRTVQITLSAVSGQNVSVTVSMTGGSATPGTDFTNPFPVTATITAGNTSTTVTIPILADLIVEGNETINLQLSSPTNATLGGVVNHTFTITDDDVGIVSAETLDANGDGQIDHYKITFTEAVNDSSFPGYVANSLGNSQTDWLVAGYSGVVLAHGTAAPETDTVNDAIIYLKFTQSGSADTDAKPDLTTTTSPTLVTMSSKTVGIVYTASVTEADRAKPVIISATTNTATNVLTVTFSEPVWGSAGMPACGSGGQLTVSGFTYNNVSGSGVSSLTGMGSDTCGTDEVVTLTANTNFTAGDHNTDTLALTSNVYDGANNTGNTTAKAISVTIGPVITSAEIFDTDKNGKIDQIKLTFNVNMQDSSISDSNVNLFTYAGSPLVKVDTASGGTGSIQSPNNDPAVANDNIVTVFTTNNTGNGTAASTLAFTQSTGQWLGNSIELQTIASIPITDKAPPVIISAVANENTNPVAGVDSDDTLVLTFSEPIDSSVNVTPSNLSSIFSTNPTRNWGSISNVTWNGSRTEMTIHFAGAGTTVAVGDYVVINNTVQDSAGNISTNIESIVPITGSFSVEPPLVHSVTSLSATSVRVTFTQPVNNSDGTSISKYKIATTVTGSCSDNSNFTSSASALSISSITMVNDYTYDLTTATQNNNTTYTLIVDKSAATGIRHKDYSSYRVGCPNNGNFVGNEKLKVVSASSASLSTIVVSFSKPLKSGMNVAGSPECNTVIECQKRFKLTGVSDLGNITNVKILDGSVCGGLASDTSKVCITHTNSQVGAVYTIIAANNTNSDGFDDAPFAIQDAGSQNLQSAPNDRASFLGSGPSPHIYDEGPIIVDPFGDGSYVGFLASYQGKIYIGPNSKGNLAARFNYNGSNPETLTFAIEKDTTGGGANNHDNSATTRDGSITVPPYVSIGHTGCTVNSGNIATGCGPDNENGRGAFASGTLGGTEFLFLGGARKDPHNTGNEQNNNFDYIYYTSDLDDVLNFKYIDLGAITGSSTAGTMSIITHNNRVIAGFAKRNDIYSNSSGSRNTPDMGKVNFSTGSTEGDCTPGQNCDASDGSPNKGLRFMINRLAHFGGSSAQGDSDEMPNTNYGLYTGVDALFVFNNYIYAGNGGHHKVGHNGSIIRSKNSNPGKCSVTANVYGCNDFEEIGPRTHTFWHNSPTNNWFSLELRKASDFIPADRAHAQFAEFNGNLYVVRTICVTTQSTAVDHAAAIAMPAVAGCNDGTYTNRRTQLWKCVPSLTGDPSHCDSGDWDTVADDNTGITNFGDVNNHSATLLVKNDDRLYVGFDNENGIKIYRTKSGVTNPAHSSNDWEQVSSQGLGDPTNVKQIFSAISVNTGSFHYVYISTGKNGIPVRVYRQRNQ